MNDILSEIIIYELVISKKKPFLFLFNKREVEKCRITYRIGEDRLWMYNFYKNKKVDDHLMKKNIDDTLNIMEEMKKRFQELDSLNKNSSIEIKVFDIRRVNPEMYRLILNYSLKKEDYYNVKRNNIFLE